MRPLLNFLKSSSFLRPFRRPHPPSSFTLHRSFSSTFPNNATVMSSASPKESFANFDLVKRVKLDFTDVTISKWKSRVTGLSVVHLDYEGEWLFLATINLSNRESSSHRQRIFCRGYRKFVHIRVPRVKILPITSSIQ